MTNTVICYCHKCGLRFEFKSNDECAPDDAWCPSCESKFRDNVEPEFPIEIEQIY
jgi:Zn finger protein HypA/HybF involved in hydrogenase expression